MTARIISTSYTKPITKSGILSQDFMIKSLNKALELVGLNKSNLDGLLTVPSLSEPKFMEGHSLATRMGIFPHPRFYAKTIDVGGAGPVSCLIEAKRLVEERGHHLVAVVSADSITSLPSSEFLKRADAGFSEGDLKSPFIPSAYNKIAEWHINQGYVTREQLAMVTVMMSQQASKHPDALTRKPNTLQDILQAKSVAGVTSFLECARRADGGAAILVASQEFLKKHNLTGKYPMIKGGGETSGPLYPPQQIVEGLFTCEEAVRQASEQANIPLDAIDFYGLYDCFPICFIKALEAVKLAPKQQGGKWLQQKYELSLKNGGSLSPTEFPINTHGGLLCFGAPWETPAMYNIIEATAQLTGAAADRQVRNAKTALVYGNGGVFSSSSVAILSNE